MATEDVIELGSSDDEAEPAPKKRKPLPNAMVHIPNKLPGITIKPSKPNQIRKQKGIPSKPLIVSKSVYNINSNIIKKKQVPGSFQIPVNNFTKCLKTQTHIPKPVPKCTINPFNINKSLMRPQLSVPLKSVIKPSEVKGSKLLNNLPPGITIKLVQNSDITKQSKKTPPTNAADVLTVEIDDEEISETITATTASPQWYLRPEELLVKKKEDEDQINDKSGVAESMEEQNNKEPESSKFVEITIEDSPLKSLPHKHDGEIGKELAITIEDSPAKVITHISNNAGSDNEDDVRKVPQSKKMLEYPKQSERQVVEIEIDLMDTSSVPVDISDSKQKEIIDKEDETMKIGNKTTNDESITNTIQETDQTKENIDGTSSNEFHPVYQNFINMCFKLENSEDMIKIVEKKIKAYYKQCPKEYVESQDFIDIVSSKTVSMKSDPDKMYLYIKDIVDELNLQRKMAKSTIVTKKEEFSKELIKEPEFDENVYNSKKRKQIRKLEKTIKKLHRAIQKLEEQEVDFDDDEDSVYLLTERYKERMVRVHKKFCQLTKTKMPSEPRLHLESRPGRPAGPAKKLEKWVNKKVPVGSLLPFPDFHDVLKCVRDSNDEDKLGFKEYEIMEEARDLFTRCGRKLQRRRQENEWRIAASRISQNADPAEESVDLKKQLNDNKALATSKEVELLNKFAEKQNQLKLEAVEIGDKEAEESPEESDDEEEEVEISNSLADKQKRKDKLKKLLQEKSTKNDEKVHDSNALKETETENEIVNTEKQEKENNETDKTENAEDNSEKNTTNSETLIESTEKREEILENTESEQVRELAKNESDSDKVESDIDELHLYQKSRKSFTVYDDNSSLESSDSDTPIAISDTLESDSDMETERKLSDIISIENSSYSESETDNYGTFPNETPKNVDNSINSNFEVEFSKENVDVEEKILLASSDEENTNKYVDLEIGDTCINLKDDNISISETMVYGKTVEQDSVNNEDIFSPETNIPSIVQESANTEDNMIIQECSEEDDNDLKHTVKSEGNEEINSNDSPKEIVDIGSLSDGNSIASVEMQTDVEKAADPLENQDHVTEDTEVNESSCDSRLSEVAEPIS